jgi:hypothetical protein
LSAGSFIRRTSLASCSSPASSSSSNDFEIGSSQIAALRFFIPPPVFNAESRRHKPIRAALLTDFRAFSAIAMSMPHLSVAIIADLQAMGRDRVVAHSGEGSGRENRTHIQTLRSSR